MSQSVEVLGGVINVSILASNFPEQQGETEQASELTPTVSLKTIMIAGAVTGALVFGSNGAQAQPINQTSGQFNTGVGINGVEGRLTQINGRSNLYGFLRSKNNSSSEDSNTIHMISGEPYIPLTSKTIFYPEIEQAVTNKMRTLEISEDISIYVESAYVKLNVSSEQPVKGGSYIMNSSPSFLRLYVDDISDSLSNQSAKLTIAAVTTALISWFGIELVTLVTGLFIVAVIDLILGLIPGNAKEGTEKDQKVQAKLLGFTTNFLVLLAFVKGGEYLRDFTANNFLGFVSNNIHFAVASWIFAIYFWRFIGYVARSNKTKIPDRIRKMFDKDVSADG